MWPAFAAGGRSASPRRPACSLLPRVRPTHTGRRRRRESAASDSTASRARWRPTGGSLGNRPVRLLALVSIALAAGFYAQFETGLPAFALQSLRRRPEHRRHRRGGQLLVIVALQWLVVRLTGQHSGAALLVVVAAIWVLSWLLLEVALFTGAASGRR